MMEPVWLLLIWTMLPGLSDVAQREEQKDVWEPLRVLVGQWEGTGEGMSGQSTVHTTFTFVLGGKFLEVRNKAVFEPQKANPKGEVHEDWGIISYDRTRKKYVFRQFHVEGFVNQYVLDAVSEDGKTFTFVTESIENIPPGWRARVTYTFSDDNLLSVVFDLAAPGKELKQCAKNHLKRKKDD